jgi:O-antigen/teichoic acid export membrane protein
MNTAPPEPVTGTKAVSESDVAKGTALAMFARFGAVIEVVAQPVYTWLFGLATYGIYITLWSAVALLSNIADLGATGSLQRLVPQAPDNETAHAHVKISLLVALALSTLIAVGLTVFAPTIAHYLNAAPEDAVDLATAVQLFAWGVPLWTLIEVSGAAMRARRAFGPEIRLKVFYEQLGRLGFAVGAFGMGMQSLGLVVAHLASMLLVTFLSFRLLGNYFDLKLLLSARLEKHVVTENIVTGLALLPANIIKRGFIDTPAIALNVMLPGAAGATAAAIYAIGRKISSILQLVRLSFGYVMSPLASTQAAAVSIAAVAPLYAYATRLATVGILPLTAGLLAIGPGLLRVFNIDKATGYPVLVVLVLGRCIEALSGPGAAILEVIGARSRSAINALIGLGVAIGLGIWLTPLYAAVGMSIAVSAGLILMSYIAAAQLMLSHQLHPLSWSLGRAFTGGALGAILVAGSSWAISLAGARFVPATALISFVPALWIAARIGLTRSDRAVLGRVGRLLKLV